MTGGLAPGAGLDGDPLWRCARNTLKIIIVMSRFSGSRS
jgi:hypothetical protein